MTQIAQMGGVHHGGTEGTEGVGLVEEARRALDAEGASGICNLGQDFMRRFIAALEREGPAFSPGVEALVAEAEKAEEVASKKLQALCRGTEQFTMRIPADRAYDHDLIFSEAFGFIPKLGFRLKLLSGLLAKSNEDFSEQSERLEAVVEEKQRLEERLQLVREKNHRLVGRLAEAQKVRIVLEGTLGSKEEAAAAIATVQAAVHAFWEKADASGQEDGKDGKDDKDDKDDKDGEKGVKAVRAMLGDVGQRVRKD